MNILVTGGSGYKGSVLIRKLLEDADDAAEMYQIIRSSQEG